MSLLSLQMLFGFSAAAIAVAAETLYRSITAPWHHYLWLWVPLQTAMSYCIYRLVTYPNTSLLAAFVTFSFCMITLRVVVSQFFLHEDIRLGTWLALALIVTAKLVQATLGR